MLRNDLNNIRSGFIVGAIAALLFAFPSGLFAQSSPLTVQPCTGRVGVGTTNPIVTFDVVGNTWGAGAFLKSSRGPLSVI
jgi:hypothetical protein